MSETTKRRFKLMIPLVIVGIVCLAMLPILLSIDDWSRDWTENTASVETDSTRNLSEIVSRVQSFADSNSAWKIQSLEQSDEQVQIELTRTSRLFRFVDDVSLTATDVGKGSKLSADSKSRVGKGDLGQNPRNLKALIEAINQTTSGVNGDS